MKYWWDKLKVVDTNLKLWDDLQALWFDACGFMLIGKWDDTYWTKWDPLTTTTTICPDVSDCPNCQPKIKTVLELNWRPEPCSSGDWFVMMTKNKTLKVICKDEFKCEDKLVWADPTDEKPWTLIDKLTVCDESWPLSINLLNKSSWHQVCIGWDPSKADINFTDLWDTPNSHKKWVVVDTWSWIDIIPPVACDIWRYSYFVYDKQKQVYTNYCWPEISTATWKTTQDYLILQNTWTAQDHSIENRPWYTELKSTEDIKKWSWADLFELTRDWVYMITCNSTIFNRDESRLKAARWWITVNWTPLWDAKYDSRRYKIWTVNDFFPETADVSDWTARLLELTIMSFNTTYIYIAQNISESNTAKVWFHVALDTRVQWDPRLTRDVWTITVALTSWKSEEWPVSVLQCVRIWDIPSSYWDR